MMKTHTSTILIDKTRGLKFTESPRWRDGKLWFLDIHDKRIKTADLEGRVETALELPFIPNAFGFPRSGRDRTYPKRDPASGRGCGAGGRHSLRCERK
jgi:hypothetical protein